MVGKVRKQQHGVLQGWIGGFGARDVLDDVAGVGRVGQSGIAVGKGSEWPELVEGLTAS